jgi:hypothetical protein
VNGYQLALIVIVAALIGYFIYRVATRKGNNLRLLNDFQAVLSETGTKASMSLDKNYPLHKLGYQAWILNSGFLGLFDITGRNFDYVFWFPAGENMIRNFSGNT